MKNRIRITAFLLLFAPFVSVFAMEEGKIGYPAYKWFNPYPREIKGESIAYVRDFTRAENLPENLDQWTGLNQCLLELEPEGLRIQSFGGDPYFSTPPIPPVNSQPVSGAVKFSITMKSEIGSRAQLFWRTSTHQNYDESRSASFDVKNDGLFRTYTVDARIEGDLQHVRFDPGTDRGTAILRDFSIYRLHLSPIEITNMSSDNESFSIEVFNHGNQLLALQVEISGSSEKIEKRKMEIPSRDSKRIRAEFPRKKAFERLKVHLSNPKEDIFLSRDAWAFHPEMETKGISLKNETLELLFAENENCAKVLFKGEPVGIICPLMGEEVFPDSVNSPFETTGVDFSSKDRRKIRATKQGDSVSVRFEPEKPDRLNPVLNFRLRENELRFEISPTKNHAVFGPVFRPIGTFEQGFLAGVEYLEKGEHSSSTADLETSEHIRFAPDPLLLTLPLVGIITDRTSFALLWDDPLQRVIFATPDIFEGKAPEDPISQRFGLFGTNLKGTLRIGPGFSDHSRVEDIFLWAVQKRGLPDLPPRPRTTAEQRELNLRGFTESELKGENGWSHAILPGGDGPFGRSFGADFVSTIWNITDEIPPEIKTLSRGGAHLENPSAFFLMRQGQTWLNQINARAEHLRNIQKEDGSFRYDGKYLKGHWEDTASGYTAQYLVPLFDHYRYTGDTRSRDAALKGLEFLTQKDFRVPRGAQVWELSIHTPDIMGSAWCCLSYLRGYEITGKKEYLELARRWALSGIPFVYQWETPLNGQEKPVMLYATTPVLGATNWVAPNWIGLPVQWCGLDYAEALFLLAPYDATLDWKKIAEGILIAAEQMQYPEGPSVGLLPDSWKLKTQTRHPYDINPVVLERLRRRAEGNLCTLDVAVSEDQKFRVASPFPIREIKENEVLIEGREGREYEILINGRKIFLISSRGLDRFVMEVVE